MYIYTVTLIWCVYIYISMCFLSTSKPILQKQTSRTPTFFHFAADLWCHINENVVSDAPLKRRGFWTRCRKCWGRNICTSSLARLDHPGLILKNIHGLVIGIHWCECSLGSIDATRDHSIPIDLINNICIYIYMDVSSTFLVPHIASSTTHTYSTTSTSRPRQVLIGNTTTTLPHQGLGALRCQKMNAVIHKYTLLLNSRWKNAIFDKYWM